MIDAIGKHRESVVRSEITSSIANVRRVITEFVSAIVVKVMPISSNFVPYLVVSFSFEF